MTIGGTAAYDHEDNLPDGVRRAVDLARELNFDLSCRPQQGRLLQTLARGRRGGTIAETGTGCGVGLAWLLSGAGSDTAIYSVERDGERAAAVAQLFGAHSNVTVLHGDWQKVLQQAPFDLLVLDGGGTGKSPGDEMADPRVAVKPFGTIVIDDFTPLVAWPPRHLGEVDSARLRWLQHPDLLATEIVVCDEMSSIVATRLP
jgi:predicted O-methyltransferase YrrM